MIILVSGATKTHLKYSHTKIFGHLVTPSGGHKMQRIIDSGLPWGADNDFFWKPDPDAFVKMLNRISGLSNCLFVSCPDVVGDAVKTLEMFARWHGEVSSRNLPVALVGQNRIENTDIPWSLINALFVGGDNEFKESRSTLELCDYAKKIGKHIHIGRVNTFRRLKKIFDWGCVDSIDGTALSKWPDKYFPLFLKNMNNLERQSTLFKDFR